jgi:hypothetical protein
MFLAHRRGLLRATAVFITVLAASAVVAAQQTFQFYISVADAGGQPVTDITEKDVVMSENGAPNEIVKVEPYRMPVKLTIAVDNGPGSGDALAHYRSGLTAMVKTLPTDMEIALITTAPQPRFVVQMGSDRERLYRGINGFAPENESPRFTDTIVEFSKRQEKELQDKKNVVDSIPILMLLSTTTNEASSYEVPEVTKALRFLQQRRAKTYISMVAQRSNVSDAAQINESRQAMIGIPLVKGTNGKYEALAISNRLTTLLPEWGQDIAGIHARNANQFRVTVNRKATGPLQNPQVQVTREGLKGAVSVDGYLP